MFSELLRYRNHIYRNHTRDSIPGIYLANSSEAFLSRLATYEPTACTYAAPLGGFPPRLIVYAPPSPYPPRWTSLWHSPVISTSATSVLWVLKNSGFLRGGITTIRPGSRGVKHKPKETITVCTSTGPGGKGEGGSAVLVGAGNRLWRRLGRRAKHAAAARVSWRRTSVATQ